MLLYELNSHGISKDPVKREFFTPGRGASQSMLLMSYIFQGDMVDLSCSSLVFKVILYVFDLWNCTFLMRHM